MPAFAIHFDLAVPAASFLCAVVAYMFVSQWLANGTPAIPKLSQLAAGRLVPAPPTADSTVYVRLPDRKAAAALARELVLAKLVLSAALLPDLVAYSEHNGEVVESSDQALLLLRARQSSLPDLVSALHVYRPVSAEPLGKTLVFDMANEAAPKDSST